MTTDNDWHRWRFHAFEDDFRPVYDPSKPTPGLGPYWCTGYGDGYSIVVAYLRTGVYPSVYWPEADNIQDGDKGPIQFSGRFPEPEWWATSPQNVLR